MILFLASRASMLRQPDPQSSFQFAKNGERTGRYVLHRHVARAVSGCGSAYPRSCDGEAGSSTTPLQDEQRHMAPSHRLVVGLSDRGEAGGRFQRNVSHRQKAAQFGELPPSGLVQTTLSDSQPDALLTFEKSRSEGDGLVTTGSVPGALRMEGLRSKRGDGRLNDQHPR